MRNFGKYIIEILFIVIGIVLITNGNAKEKRCTVETEGKVVEIYKKESQDSDGIKEYTYYPIVEYVTNKKTVRQMYLNGGSYSDYKVNSRIKVKYNPNNVDEFIIKGDKTNSVIGIIFIVIGVGIFIAVFFDKRGSIFLKNI